jgi:hypothetical protein
VEPVVVELLRYFEKDEARHVGLGMQFLPSQLKGLSGPRAASLLAFQVKLMVAALLELKAMEPHLAILRIPVRKIFLLGMAKQALALDLLWQENGRTQALYPTVGRLLAALGELLFPGELPPAGSSQPALNRTRSLRHAAAAVRAALRTFRDGIGASVPASSLDPEGPSTRPSALW